MNFIIYDKVLCEDLPKKVITFIKDSLTVVNPEFADRVAMEKSIFGVDQHLKYYEKVSKGSYKIPVGFFEDLIQFCLDKGYDIKEEDLVDKRIDTSDKKFFSNLKFTAKLRPYQEPIEKHCLNSTVGIIQAKTGSGKCLGKGTPVLMYDGTIKNVEDIKKGDFLMGPDSKKRQVLSINRGREELFKINPVKGDSWVCNKSHILALHYSGNATKSINSEDKINISVEEYLTKNKTFRRNTKLYRSKPINYPKQDVPIDPYYFGLWLGDGTKRNSSITTNDDTIVNYLEKYAKDRNYLLKDYSNDNRCSTYHLIQKKGYKRGNKHPFRVKLESLGVYMNKHFPQCYLVNDVKTRLSLLAGYVDADGHLDTGCIEITTKLKTLKDGLLYLCRSLGLAAYSTVKKVKINGKILPYHRISISGHIDKIPCKLLRKQANKRNQIKNVLHTGFDLEPLGVGDYYGFEISGDRLFLLGDFTVTHNTVSFIKVIYERKVNTMVLVDTKDLADQTVSAITQFTNLKEEDIGFIGDGRYEVKPITVCILKSLTLMDEKKKREVHSYFGQVITDEVHIIAAQTYFKAQSSMPAKYKFGFSATPKRSDGLTSVIFWANGPLRYKVPDEDVAHALIIPSYEQIYTDYHFPLFDTSEYQAMLTHMAEDEERNNLILEEFMKRKDRPSVFLCMRQSHVEILANLIPSCVPLISSLKKKDRKENMKKLRSGESQNVSTTFALFAKGLDVPHLELAYLCGPMKAEVKLRQLGGRIMRKSDSTGKTSSHIVDFIDKKVGLLYGQSRTRARILRDL